MVRKIYGNTGWAKKVIIFTTDFFCKVMQQQYVGEVGKSIIVMLQINSV